MKILVVEPMKPCEVREIPDTLEAMQALVGGHIQAVYPFRDDVALVCNEEGRNLGLPYNRPLTNDRGVPYDMICGSCTRTTRRRLLSTPPGGSCWAALRRTPA